MFAVCRYTIKYDLSFMTQAIIQQIETDVTCTWMFEMNNLYVDV